MSTNGPSTKKVTPFSEKEKAVFTPVYKKIMSGEWDAEKAKLYFKNTPQIIARFRDFFDITSAEQQAALHKEGVAKHQEATALGQEATALRQEATALRQEIDVMTKQKDFLVNRVQQTKADIADARAQAIANINRKTNAIKI